MIPYVMCVCIVKIQPDPVVSMLGHVPDVAFMSLTHRLIGGYRYPSYVEDIMGDIFSLGFGPFRWVCTSGLPADLAVTDQIGKNLASVVRLPGVFRMTVYSSALLTVRSAVVFYVSCVFVFKDVHLRLNATSDCIL